MPSVEGLKWWTRLTFAQTPLRSAALPPDGRDLKTKITGGIFAITLSALLLSGCAADRIDESGTDLSSGMQKIKDVRKGQWRTLEWYVNSDAVVVFDNPIGAQVKVRRGVGFLGWDDQKETIRAGQRSILYIRASYIPSRAQMKVAQSTNVAYETQPFSYEEPRRR